MKKIILTILFLGVTVALPRASLAQHDSPLKINGYYKALYTNTESLASRETITGVTNRLRLEAQKVSDPWQFFLSVNNEALFNDFANTSDFDLIRSKIDNNLATIDMDKVSVDNDHLYLRHSVYRAYVKYYKPEFQAVIGRQAVDWGIMRFYSPLDVFNSVGELDLEQDERFGSDAVNLNFSPDALPSLNIVAIPDETDDTSSGGVKLSQTVGTYDLALIGAMVRKDKIVGLSFDGYLKAAGLRGEINYNKQDNGREFPRAGIGMDYTFNDKFYVLAEQFYNGGYDDNNTNALTSSYNQSRQLLSLQPNLTSLWLNYKITPLLELDHYIIYDWNGQSVMVNPELKYDVARNIDLRAGTQLFFGNTTSEFGDYAHLYYAEMKVFF